LTVTLSTRVEAVAAARVATTPTRSVKVIAPPTAADRLRAFLHGR
jgi:hypothetical protein